MMDGDTDLYSWFLAKLRAEFPQMRLKRKSDSWLMHTIAGLLRFITFGVMDTFMTDYITTVGFTVYVPDSWASTSAIDRVIVLRHERVHMRQRVRYGMFLFSLLYLLFPLPIGLAYFRMKFEREAYAETLRAQVDLLGDRGRRQVLSPKSERDIIGHFTGPAYFWMWPFKKSMRAWYAQVRAAAIAPR